MIFAVPGRIFVLGSVFLMGLLINVLQGFAGKDFVPGGLRESENELQKRKKFLKVDFWKAFQSQVQDQVPQRIEHMGAKDNKHMTFARQRCAGIKHELPDA